MLTEQEYKHLRNLYDRKHEWVKEQKFFYRSEDMPKEFLEITNEVTSQIEIYEWITNPPESYFCYINEKKHEEGDWTITTWMGDELGRYEITGQHWEMISNSYLDEDENEVSFKEKQQVQDIRVYGSNGVTYIGKYYYQNGDYCTMEKEDE